jgi:hypothetical protein
MTDREAPMWTMSSVETAIFIAMVAIVVAVIVMRLPA